jgi:uncharacterized membrane protein
MVGALALWRQPKGLSMHMDFLVQVMFDLPAAGIAWALQRTTRMSQQTAELVGAFVAVGFIAAACFAAWLIYQSTLAATQG